jgi:RHS repeat-associated protein
MKLKRYFLYAAIAMTMGRAQAQTAVSASDEYDRVITGAQTIATLGPDLFGESVNLKDGSTSFATTDVRIPTTSGLPLAIGRQLGVNTKDADKYVQPVVDGELFGNWKLDVPMIHGTFDERTGWASGSASNPSARCSIVSAPPGVRSAFSGWDIYYYSEDYWHGNTIEIPGKGKYPMLARLADNPAPADGDAYRWTTKGNWSISCIPLRNGAGEGFRVTLPDGTRYSFDWMSSRRAAALKDTHCENVFLGYEVRGVNVGHLRPQDLSRLHRLDSGGSINGGGQATICNTEVVVNRREYFLHATKVEDRFGNQVIYNYDPSNPRRLLSMASSDGGTIGLSYGTNGKISTISTNGRQWQYQYEADARFGSKLVAVVQPDNSRWTFNYGELSTILDYDKKVRWPDCEPMVAATTTAVVTIGHPSGATGAFSFRNMLHGVDRTPGGCSQPNPDRPLKVDLSHHLMAYKVASLISKQITGPGLTPQVWSYAYQPSWSWNPSGYVDDCGFAPALCESTSKTEVTAPDGTITRSTFGNDYYRSVGQLQKTELISSGVIIQQKTFGYVGSPIGQAYAARAGADLFLRNNLFDSEQVHPLQATTQTQDGSTFNWAVDACGAIATPCFDVFARPTKVRKYNSLGYSRTEATEYHDNLSLWVLGQVRRQYVPSTSPNGLSSTNSMVASETEYNAQAMPWKTYAFGKLKQILSYTAQGNLNTVTDGNGNTVFLGDYYRGIPRVVGFPATPEAPSGATQGAAVDANGWITSVTDEVGAKTCYGYDNMGRINSITHPSETQPGVCDTSRWAPVSLGFQQIAFDEHGLPAGHWRMHRYEGNKHINTYFDAMWRPVLEEQLDATNIGGTLSQTVKRYDVMGRASFVSYPQRGVGSFVDVTQGTHSTYDALGRVVRVEQDSEHSRLATVTEYLNGLRTRVTNPRGAVSITGYLAWDEPSHDYPIASVLPEGKVIQIDRHPQFGWPLRMTQRSADSAVSQSRHYVYDGNAQLCKTVEPETGATVMGYDNAGNLAWSAAGLDRNTYGDIYTCHHTEAWSSGRRVSRTYDARNRLATLSFPDTRGNQTWSYTPDGLPATITAANHVNSTYPVSTSYTYNKRRLLVTEALQQPGWYTWTLSYGYDGIGNQSSLSYPTGLVVDFAPNALGQATKAGSFASNAQYYANGAIQQFTYGNGIVHTMTQNARQLPSRTTSSGGVLDYVNYYDANGNVDHIANELVAGWDPGDRWMQYDALDRLTAAGSGSFGGDHWHHFTYDALDNIKSWKLAGVKDYADYVYDAQTHRLTSIRNSLGAAVQNFEYDAQGNLQAKNSQGFDFDFGNRLRGAVGKEYYRYDALGRRVMTWKPDGATTLWQYNQAGQMVFTWDGPSNEKTHEHVYLSGSLIATVDHNWPSNTIIATKYHHTDALGSPVAVTNATGQVIERNDYEPYGSVIGKPTFSGVGYTGHIMDGATGLTYMQQRYYDQSIGRFLSVDPVTADTKLGGNFNRYRYASNNPYRFVDPDGRRDDDVLARYAKMAWAAHKEGRLDYLGLAVAGGDFVIGSMKLAVGTEFLAVAVFTPVPGDEFVMFLVAADGSVQMYDGVTGAMTAIDGKDRLSGYGELGSLFDKYLGAKNGATVGEIFDAGHTLTGAYKALKGKGPAGEALHSILDTISSADKWRELVRDIIGGDQPQRDQPGTSGQKATPSCRPAAPSSSPAGPTSPAC